jgi:ferric-dicitrate binding protein FerR (iron transport regulator)
MTAARAFRDHSKAFVNLSIYEQRLHRTIKEAFRQLRELKAERERAERKAETERRELEQNAAREQQASANASQTQDLTTPKTGNGFVYASAEMASQAMHPDPLEPMPIIQKSPFDPAQPDSFASQQPLPCAA